MRRGPFIADFAQGVHFVLYPVGDVFPKRPCPHALVQIFGIWVGKVGIVGVEPVDDHFNGATAVQQSHTRV
jgi:hypothetical protein